MDKIRELREANGIRQSELASRLGVSQNTVSQWETGTRVPRVDTLKKIASLFGCTVDDLLKPEKETAG